MAQEKAMYFEKGNIADLAEKLHALCEDNSLVENLRDGADEFILNKYSWRDVAEATCALYKKQK